MKYQTVLHSFFGRLLVLVAIVAMMTGTFAVTGSTVHAQRAALRIQAACNTYLKLCTKENVWACHDRCFDFYTRPDERDELQKCLWKCNDDYCPGQPVP